MSKIKWLTIKQKIYEQGGRAATYYPIVLIILFTVISLQYPFTTLESLLYDLRIRFDFKSSSSLQFVVVTLNQESDEFLGESSPYSLTNQERVIRNILKDGPRAVLYYTGLPNVETDQDQENMIELYRNVDEYRLQGGFFRFARQDDDTEQSSTKGFLPSSILGERSYLIQDGVWRRILLEQQGEVSIELLAANALRSKVGEKQLTLRSIFGATYYPRTEVTSVLFRYPNNPTVRNGEVRTIPFHRVIVQNYPKDFFKNKVILIGNAYTLHPQNFSHTPFDRGDIQTPRLAVAATMISALFDKKTVALFPRVITDWLTLILGVVMAIVIAKYRPTRSIKVIMLTVVSLLLISYLLFILFGVWIYIIHLLLAVMISYIVGVPFKAVSEYQRRFAIQEESALLQKVEGLKQNFISFMSHDLKTPVAKIAAIVDNLKHSHAEDKELVFNLDHISEATRELNRFITSILDLTKIESRNLTLKLMSKDINIILEQIVATLSYEMKLHEVQFQMTQGPLYPIQVDPILIQRVFSNLIENAIKYGGRGVSIEVKTWDDHEFVYVQIADTGPGVPSDDLEFIFDKFYRVKNDASHSIKGSGLGLYLVKYFLELHGGSISVTSMLGVGTTFVVKLKNQ